MGSLGWHNPVPCEVGGGATLIETIYAALRSAVGKGGSAQDDTGIEGCWRQSKAVALGNLASFGERAALQAFPQAATDALEYYEDLLGLSPGAGDTMEDRQFAAAAAFSKAIPASTPDVASYLADLDSRFSILEPSVTTTTQHGRVFEDWALTEPYSSVGGGRRHTDWPNYSTDFVLFLLFELGSGVAPGLAELRLLDTARRELNDILPTWIDVSVTTHVGFTLDLDVLDGTSFGS